MSKTKPQIKFKKFEDGLFHVVDLSPSPLSIAEGLYFYTPLRADRYFYGIEHIQRTLINRYFPDCDARVWLEKAVVIDIGANVGEFSLACLGLGAREVIAFEPDEKAFACLQKNTQRFSNIEIQNVMLSDKAKKQTFYLSSDDADSSLIEPFKFTNKVELDGLPLDRFGSRIKDGPIVLKVEAEGAEPEVLLGATKLLKRRDVRVTVRASFERRGKSTMEDCQRVLQKHGYATQVGLDGKQLLGEPE